MGYGDGTSGTGDGNDGISGAGYGDSAGQSLAADLTTRRCSHSPESSNAGIDDSVEPMSCDAGDVIVDAGDGDAEHGSGGPYCTGDFAKDPVTNNTHDDRFEAGYCDSAHSAGLSLTANPTIRRCSYGPESSNVITNSDAADLVGDGDDGTSEACYGDSAGQSLAADPTIRRGSYSPASGNAAANVDAAELVDDRDDGSADDGTSET
jgi:hypothetical protein